MAKPGYKETAVGWIPVEWKSDALEALVSIVYGKSPSDIAKLGSGVPIYGTGGISGYTDNSLCDGPSIILGRKGTIDKVQFSEQPFWAIDTTFYTVQKTAFDWRWLYFVLSSFDLRKLNEASGVPSLSRENLGALDIAVPPLPEQQKIAAILTAVDDKLDLIARQISATQTLKQGLMQTLFTRGAGTPDAQGRWHPHTEFQDAELGRIPVGWKMRSLGEIAPLIRRPVEVDASRLYPELGLRSYGKGTFHKPALLGSMVGNKRLFEIKAGDLLLSNVFAWEGAVAVASPEDDGRFGSHRYITCKVDPVLADTRFICRYLVTPAGTDKLSLASPGGAGRNKTLGLGALADIEVPCPPTKEQRKITMVLDGVDAKLNVLTTQQTHYQSLKRGLMQKLLTGQWRVRVDVAAQATAHEEAPA